MTTIRRSPVLSGVPGAVVGFAITLAAIVTAVYLAALIRGS